MITALSQMKKKCFESPINDVLSLNNHIDGNTLLQTNTKSNTHKKTKPNGLSWLTLKHK